jgi:Mlc titration factor MtfA (ptsG expression regulator)
MWKQKRRRNLQLEPFPPGWSRVLATRCPFYQRLSKEDQEELQGHIQVFIAEKNFEGCGGLTMTDEIRVCIAAQACLLLLHRKTDYYAAVQSILVYPSTYFAKATRHMGGGVMEEGYYARLGEAWQRGAVVLAWDAVCRGTADPDDGHNVVFHEFAHQLDYEDGWANGAPALGDGHSWSARRSRYAAWARVLSTEFQRLQADIQRGENAVLDSYGAKNPAEFFAVATEAFFERPRQMRENHSELYEELKRYYVQDPAERASGPEANRGDNRAR